MSNQYFATNRKVGDGSTTVWSFSFEGARPDNQNGTAPYLEPEHVLVALVEFDEVGRETRTPVERALIGPSQVSVIPPIPDGQDFVIYRRTGRKYPVSDFVDFSSIDERDLDDAFRQALFLAQEVWDSVLDAEGRANEALSAIPIAEEAHASASQALDLAQAARTDSQLALSRANQALVASEAAEEAAQEALSESYSAYMAATQALYEAGTALSVAEQARGAALVAEQVANQALSGMSAIQGALAEETQARIAADNYLQEQIGGEMYPVGQEVSPVMYHDRVVRVSVVVPDDYNAASYGPDLEVGSGVDVIVGLGSTWTILE